MVERRKNNWLVRQLSRMGSMRSQSTAYSSGGMPFNRNRLNSVYSSPESGLPLTILQQQQLQQAHQQQQAGMQPSKSSLYGKFVHRKSIRAQRQLIKQSKNIKKTKFKVVYVLFKTPKSMFHYLNYFLFSGSKLNGLNVNVAKSRPRIPTPEVAKDGNTNPGE